MTRISVGLANYNGATCIRQQLESILNQLRADDDIIVFDDTASDDALKTILSLSEPRVKIFVDQEFSSPINKFQHAMKHAQGDFVLLSGQNDLWLERKVNTAMDALRSDCKIKYQLILPSY